MILLNMLKLIRKKDYLCNYIYLKIEKKKKKMKNTFLFIYKLRNTQEIGLVYYRAGYDPIDYPSEKVYLFFFSILIKINK